VIAWAAVDPATGELEHECGETLVPAASTIKVFIYSAFRRSQLDPSETVAAPQTGGSGVAEYLRTQLTLADHAFLMLAVSDNASANILLDRLGYAAVADEVARLGLRRTHVRRAMMSTGDENLTTPNDLAHGFAHLLQESFAPHMLKALRVAADAGSFLPHLLPAEVTVAAKSGDLPDSVRHELAYLEHADRTLVTAVCSSPPARPDALADRAAALWAARRH
jgi:beta-lactamase class A